MTMLVMYALSMELRFQGQKAALQSSMEQYQKWDFVDLPKKCQLKLVTVLNGSPKEIAEALSDPMVRPLWDTKLSSIVKKDGRSIECVYKGVAKPITYMYDFEMMPISQGKPNKSFIVSESFVNMGGLK